jgi:hypothetical protein
MELLGVIEMDVLNQTLHWPMRLDLALRQPLALTEHRMGDAEGNTRRGRRFERQMKSHDTARVNVDRQSEPRSTYRFTSHGVHDDDINQGVVNLH